MAQHEGNGLNKNLLLFAIIASMATSVGSLGLSGTNYYTSQVIDAKFHEEKQERKEEIARLDIVLQRETRLLDDRLEERLDALSEKLEAQILSNEKHAMRNDELISELRQRINELEKDNAKLRIEVEHLNNDSTSP